MKNTLLLISIILLISSCQNQTKSAKEVSAKASDKVEKIVTKATTIKAPEVPSSTTINLEGIDISQYQTGIDWNKVKADNINFVFVKATGGQTYIDPSFKQHWTNVKNAGLMRGAYHFYYTKDDPTTQANFFISNVLSVSTANDMPPVLDIESGGVNTDISVAQLQQDIQTFLTVVENAFGRKPILYTSHSFAQQYFNNPIFDKYYLWLAEYADAPIVPTGWANSGWTFWQDSPSASVDGVTGNVDHDYFNGSLSELKGL